jgi:hypothetical protein
VQVEKSFGLPGCARQKLTKDRNQQSPRCRLEHRHQDHRQQGKREGQPIWSNVFEKAAKFVHPVREKLEYTWFERGLSKQGFFATVEYSMASF